MKRKVLFSLVLIIIILIVAGCSKTKISSNEQITMTCTGEKDNSTGFEIQNIVTYHFSDKQYVTSYSVVTTQKFDDKSVYEEYKKAQEETVSGYSDGDITYNLKSDDKNMSLVFTMTINNINVDDAETEEEKKNLKASSVLKSNESSGYTCVVDGISKKEIK